MMLKLFLLLLEIVFFGVREVRLIVGFLKDDVLLFVRLCLKKM